MGMTKQEISDLASRYVEPGSVQDFVFEGEVFCLLMRELPPNKVLEEEEGWAFRGYGICVGYTLDDQAKPKGKWVWMHFASLETFPPSSQVLKLQPPHIVKGRFQNPERSHEFRILKVGLNVAQMTEQPVVLDGKIEETEKKETPAEHEKIVQFRRKK